MVDNFHRIAPVLKILRLLNDVIVKLAGPAQCSFTEDYSVKSQKQVK